MVLDITKEEWDVVEGKQTHLYTIKDDETGFMVQISDYGATLVHVTVPNKDGKPQEITFGQDNAGDFRKNGGYLGAMVGRVANRIENGLFELEGTIYEVAKNNADKHCLHGGIEGFTFQMWECKRSEVINSGKKVEVEFTYLSKDGEENFPGNLTTRITYEISTEPPKLSWEFVATTDKTTIVNLTNHAYWTAT